MLRSRRVWSVVVGLVLLVTPRAGWTQSATTGAIAGVAKDTTGAVLPGVTVEAASPVLIEKVRSVATDDQGNYKIVNLRPGTYSVTFSLAGFSTYKRDGVEVTLGSTSSINGDMKVGSLEETVTVSGSSPVVDVQNVRTQQALSAELLQAVPTAKTYVGMAALTLGASGGGAYTGTSGNRDVGGNNGDGVTSMSIHGSRTDGGFNIEGMRANSLTGGGFNRRFHLNQVIIQESVAETGGQSAETETGGVSINTIFREGGNSFSGRAETEYTGDKMSWMQSTNIGDRLTARGISGKGNRENFIYATGVGAGGKLKRDKVWFYTAARFWGSNEDQAGTYYNQAAYQHTLTYVADLTRPGHTDSWVRDSSSRLTWQVSEKQKISGLATIQKLCSCLNGVSVARAPENTPNPYIGPGFLGQVNWSNPRTNKFFIEAGFAVRFGGVNNKPQPELNATDIPVLELSNNFSYGPAFGTPGSGGPYGNIGLSKQYNTMFSTSYITGSHALKFGSQTITGSNPNNGGLLNNDFPVRYQLRNGVPVSLDEMITPAAYLTNVKYNWGLFLQDQWTMKKLTLNLGVRMDLLNAYAPEATRPAAYFLPATVFAKTENLPNWKDISPRVGAAYDLFGNGKTAIKAAFGRYVVSEATTIAQNRNPQGALTVQANRAWTDADGDRFPDCDLRNNVANGECGAMNNRNFGTTVFTNTYDPDFLNGWGKRTYNYQMNATVQQDLGHGMGLMVGYFRTQFGNITVNENTAVTASDFDSFCITAPTDTRLGDFSGTQVCDVVNIKPASFGRVSNVIHVDKGRAESFNGVDIALRARFGNGGLVNGGVSLGKSTIDNLGDAANNNCTVTGTTQLKLFCEITNLQNQVKFNVSYPVYKGLMVAAVYQNIPGTNIEAVQVLTNAQVAPALGRNLSGGAATISVPLVSPNALRERRGQQLDMRFSKTLKAGRATFRPGFDIYNLLNRDDVLSSVTTFGAAFMRPGAVLPARLYKFNLQVDF